MTYLRRRVRIQSTSEAEPLGDERGLGLRARLGSGPRGAGSGARTVRPGSQVRDKQSFHFFLG